MSNPDLVLVVRRYLQEYPAPPSLAVFGPDALEAGLLAYLEAIAASAPSTTEAE